MRSMRALVFMPDLDARGGAERYAVTLAIELADLGYDVLLATTGQQTVDQVGEYFDVDMSKVRMIRLDVIRGLVERLLPSAVYELHRDIRWKRTLSRLEPDLFFNAKYKSEISGVGAANVSICHFPHHLHNEYQGVRLPYMKALGILRRLLVGNFIDGIDRIFANSEFTADHVRRRWGRVPEVLYPPCPPLKGARSAPKRREIIAVGRFSRPQERVPNKMFDVLIDAFRIAPDLHDEGWVLNIVGSCAPSDENYLDELRRRAAGFPITFRPNAPFTALRELYGSASIYWHAQGFGQDASQHPETQEHFGISVVEALSAGCVPIVINSGGPREIVNGMVAAYRWNSVEELLKSTRTAVSQSPREWSDAMREAIRRAQQLDVGSFSVALAQLLKAGANT